MSCFQPTKGGPSWPPVSRGHGRERSQELHHRGGERGRELAREIFAVEFELEEGESDTSLATERRLPAGLRERHGRTCGSVDGGRCTCSPSIEAFVYLPREGRKLRKAFSGPGAKKAARDWRAERLTALSRGTLRTPTRRTFREEAESWQRRAEAGETFTRSGRPYKASVVRLVAALTVLD